MESISIKTLPHEYQRYDTVGDYFREDGMLNFRISQMPVEWHEWLILIHEMVEYILIKKRGISIEEIDAFDMAFTGEGEPGDDPKAPYHDEHQIATVMEKMLCMFLAENWKDYDAAVNAAGE